ncbi:Suppressor of Sensor Kinase (SLN1) [Basidiobolus ranarum]|uniref:Suppressor of Sensor Kinase (SLN1) n=1 Tax=Basidiobolus ranarum TaxID=34480 RepID=A0ABR2W295_9FUNG
MTYEKLFLGKSFYIAGFDDVRYQQLHDTIVSHGGSVILDAFMPTKTSYVLTTPHVLEAMRDILAELLTFNIPIVDEGFVWSSVQQGFLVNPDMFDLTREISATTGPEEPVRPNLNSNSSWSTTASDLQGRHTYEYEIPRGDGHGPNGHIKSHGEDPNGPYFGSQKFDRINSVDSDSDDAEIDDYEEKSFMATPSLEFESSELIHDTEAQEIHRERLEWRGMLASVLTGEVIKSEKMRISDSLKSKQQKAVLSYQNWLGIRALLRQTSVSHEKRFLEEARSQIDGVLQEVISFHIENESVPVIEQVAEILQKVDQIESLYPTRKAIMDDKPLYASQEFQFNLDALTSWCTVTMSIQMQLKILKNWTGSDSLQVAGPKDTPANPDEPSFIERILKENGLQRTFEKRTLSTLNSLLSKAKVNMIENASAYSQMSLPSYTNELQQLVRFPTSLMEECLRLRLEYAERITDPTTLMLDQMTEDFRVSLSLACRIKHEYQELTKAAPGWEVPNCIDERYDSALFDSLKYYFKLLHWRLKGGSKAVYFKEAEILESEWNFLSEISLYIDGGEWETAEQFCSLTNRLLCRVLLYFESQMRVPPEMPVAGLIKWYNRVLENVRMGVRKLLRFSKLLSNQYESASEYIFEPSSLDLVLGTLSASGHVLAYTGSFERDGLYILIDSSLCHKPDSVRRLMGTSIARDNENIIGKENYLLVINPGKRELVWHGQIIQIDIDHMNINLGVNRIRLISESSSSLADSKRVFSNRTKGIGINIIHNQKSHIPKVHKEQNKIKKTVFKLAETILFNVNVIRESTKHAPSVDLIENCFSFASDFGQRALKFVETGARSQLNLPMIRLAIDWVNFVVLDCVPTEKKTFRWAVIALEFVMQMTRANNILLLSEEEFELLQSKVAICMTLLVSHVDIAGARSAHEAVHQAEQEKQSNMNAAMDDLTKRLQMTVFSTFASDSSLIAVRDEWMRKLNELDEHRTTKEQDGRLIGKVLSDNRPEDLSLVFLASSSSNISLRWQQGKFIGGGTFGSVYLAINLDSGDLMAVKEVRFTDSSSLTALHKSIKEEMSIMERLDHPNIVKYFGLEVHRDKVYIFMEYCQGGSLADLLEHGRIEDENVAKVYTLQMLHGLEYLHENSIVHRDVKPDNILLDHNGLIKFVDFGAAKVIARNQKTMGRATNNQQMKVNSLTGTPMYMAPEVITGGDRGRQGSQDIWSLGCCILEMTTGRRPWSNLDNEWAVMYHVVTGHPPLPDQSQLSEMGMDFLKKCFTRSPSSRPTAQELLQHPWVKDIKDVNMDQRWSAALATGLVNSSPTSSLAGMPSLPSLGASSTNTSAGLVTIPEEGFSNPFKQIEAANGLAFQK